MACILDVFNEDCWRLVLDLLPTKDIVRSERVSRGWQNVIFQYLQGVSMSIEYPWYGHNTSRMYRTLKMEEDNPENFKQLTRKWGPCIKKTDCVNEESLEVIRRNCPNLEDVTFYGLQDDVLSSGSPKTFKKLKRVHFRGCDSVRIHTRYTHYAKSSTLKDCFAFCGLYCFILKAYFGNTRCVQLTDKCVKHWLVNYNIEELAVSGAEELTAKCLVTPHSSKLKALCFKECEILEYRHLLSATKHLRLLKKLELIYVPREIFRNVHMLLDQLPDLEELCLRWEKRMGLGEEWGAAVGRLGLRRLDVSFNPDVTDEWLEQAACGFGRLRELLLEGCLGVSGVGVAAACGAAGAALRRLQLGCNLRVRDDTVEHVVRSCPNLNWIDLSFCHSITEDVVSRAGNARSDKSGRLRLTVAGTPVQGFEEDKYPGLILDFGD